MDVNEIRVGNYVDNNVECFKLAAKDLIFLLAFDNEHYANPIEINSEWLVGLGFRLKQKDEPGDDDAYEHSNYNFFDFIIFKSGNDFKIYFKGSFLITLKYVHQVQNLCFYLTGKELTS